MQPHAVRVPFRNSAALLLAASLALSGCATKTGDRATLHDQSDRMTESMAMGAGAGAALGAIIGMIVSDDKAAGAGIGAAAGAALGAGAGYVVNARQQEYASREERLDAMIDATRAEVAESRKTVTAANRVVAEHRRTVNALKAEYRRGTLPAAEYRQRLAVVREDQQALAKIVAGTDRQVAELDKEIAALRREGANTAELAELRRQLIDDRNTLRRQLAALTGAVDNAPAPVS